MAEDLEQHRPESIVVISLYWSNTFNMVPPEQLLIGLSVRRMLCMKSTVSHAGDSELSALWVSVFTTGKMYLQYGVVPKTLE